MRKEDIKVGMKVIVNAKYGTDDLCRHYFTDNEEVEITGVYGDGRFEATNGYISQTIYFGHIEKVVGKEELPMLKTEEIKIGDKVIVRKHDYPFMHFFDDGEEVKITGYTRDYKDRFEATNGTFGQTIHISHIDKIVTEEPVEEPVEMTEEENVLYFKLTRDFINEESRYVEFLDGQIVMIKNFSIEEFDELKEKDYVIALGNKVNDDDGEERRIMQIVQKRDLVPIEEEPPVKPVPKHELSKKFVVDVLESIANLSNGYVADAIRQATEFYKENK